MTVNRIPLDLILGNTYQQRLEEDKDHIQKLARSILDQGLLETPVGRRIKGSDNVELCFGMSRLAAFKVLHADKKIRKERGDVFAHMPVDLRKLSDRQMFEMATAENIARKDLTIIEKARAMQLYMTVFEAKRTEAGNLFGYKPGSVSNIINLLELPEKIQMMVHSGELPERSARQFLHVSRADETLATEAAQHVVDDPESSPDTLRTTLLAAMNKATHMLQDNWQSSVGGRWWKLDDDFPASTPNITRAANAIAPLATPPGKDGQFNIAGVHGSDGPEITETLNVRVTARKIVELLGIGNTVEEIVRLYGYPEEAVRRISWIGDPPACSNCKYAAVLAGSTYCGLEPCAKQKQETWKELEFAKVSRKRAYKGIRRYNKRDDGAAFEHPGYEYHLNGAVRQAIEPFFDKALEAKGKADGDLRLKLTNPKTYGQHGHTESRMVALVIVGDTLKKAKAKAEKAGARQDDDWETQHLERQLQDKISDQVYDAAVPLIAPFFKDIKGDVALTLMYAFERGDFADFGQEEPFEGWADWSTRKRNTELQKYLANVLIRKVAGGTWSEKAVAKVPKLEAFGQVVGLDFPEGWADEALIEPVIEAEGDDGAGEGSEEEAAKTDPA